MYELALVALGAALWPAIKLAALILHCLLVAFVDATNFYRYRQLKVGVSRLHWIWIIPDEFLRSFCRTIVARVNGLERVL